MNKLLELPKALPHGEIQKVIEDVFYVMGNNLIIYNNQRIQASRTMTIVRENAELTLINIMIFPFE